MFQGYSPINDTKNLEMVTTEKSFLLESLVISFICVQEIIIQSYYIRHTVNNDSARTLFDI